MIYLAAYLFVGVVVLVVLLVANRAASDPYLDMNAHSPRLMWLPINVVVPLLGGITVVLAWPLGILWKIKDLMDERAQAAREKASIFAVRSTDLLQQMTLAEIEKLERIADPLGAVPDLPFGHLNGAWQRFIANMSPDDSVQAFSTVWTTRWGNRELRSGYVNLQGTKVGAYFLASRKPLHNP